MHPALIQASRNIRKRYNAIPPDRRRRARNIILIIVLILLFKNKISGALRKMFHKDINKLEVDQSKLTYTRGEYFSMCSTLEAAMNGSGTQEDPIMDVMMRLRTQDDWNFLQKSFGIRKKDGGTFYSDITGDLKTWIADELDSGEMKEVKDILSRQGISY